MSIYKPVTLITGASAGIGTALAKAFAMHGHEVALVARREAQLNHVAAEIVAAGKRRPHVIPIDLARADSPARIAHELFSRGLEPAIVVNNAGFGLYGKAAELDRTAQRDMIDLNVSTLTDLSLRWIDSLARYRGGILNVASVSGFLPGPGMAVYHATKAYVVSFTEALHHELKPRGVRVTALCPGPVETEFHTRAGILSGSRPGFRRAAAERVAEAGYRGLMAGKRIVIPGFANKVVAFLPRILPRGAMLRLAARYQQDRDTGSKPKTAKPDGWPRRAPRS